MFALNGTNQQFAILRNKDMEKLAENLALFLVTSRKFLSRLCFGGPLQFRLKMNNLRALRALLGKRQATVLEDYLRFDRAVSLAELDSKLPDILEDLLHETAWSLGIQITASEIKNLRDTVLKDIQ